MKLMLRHSDLWWDLICAGLSDFIGQSSMSSIYLHSGLYRPGTRTSAPLQWGGGCLWSQQRGPMWYWVGRSSGDVCASFCRCSSQRSSAQWWYCRGPWMEHQWTMHCPCVWLQILHPGFCRCMSHCISPKWWHCCLYGNARALRRGAEARIGNDCGWRPPYGGDHEGWHSSVRWLQPWRSMQYSCPAGWSDLQHLL